MEARGSQLPWCCSAGRRRRPPTAARPAAPALVCLEHGLLALSSAGCSNLSRCLPCPPLLQNAAQPGSQLRLGSCGFSAVPSTRADGAWPGVNVAALGPSSPLVQGLTMAACGACLEVQCGQGGNVTAAQQVRGGCNCMACFSKGAQF